MSGMKKDDKVMEYELEEIPPCVYSSDHTDSEMEVSLGRALRRTSKQPPETLVFQLPASFFYPQGGMVSN